MMKEEEKMKERREAGEDKIKVRGKRKGLVTFSTFPLAACVTDAQTAAPGPPSSSSTRLHFQDYSGGPSVVVLVFEVRMTRKNI
ncbi:hypothetical protein E2C01_101657 [Portunus trituberculatus]|uniref:Uncharacterized protein n=1 Tax=Portunus trituberculatus TaxID=210409 RepID=A0A5B7KG96_PORTR|nr:hypothetical protein [Portunus trituberculatus]